MMNVTAIDEYRYFGGRALLFRRDTWENLLHVRAKAKLLLLVPRISFFREY